MKKIITFLALLLAASCGPQSNKDERGYVWRKAHPPITSVVPYVAQTREEFLRLCGTEADACAIRNYQVEVCHVVSLYNRLTPGTYIHWHEYHHCEGWDHE